MSLGSRRVVINRVTLVSPSIAAALYTGIPLVVMVSVASLTASMAGRIGVSLVLALWATGYAYLSHIGAISMALLALQLFLGLATYSRARLITLLRSITIPAVVSILAGAYLYLVYWRLPLDIEELSLLSSNGGLGLILAILALFTYNMAYSISSPETYRIEAYLLKKAGRTLLPLTVYILTIAPIIASGTVFYALITGYIASKITEHVGARRFKLLAYIIAYYAATRLLGIEPLIQEALLS